MKFLALVLLSIALILEACLTTIPFVFLALLCLVIRLKENWLFVIGFIFGLLLDLVSFRTLGGTSVFLTIFLFLVLLYQSKFEIATNTFVLVSAFLGSSAYLFFQGYTHLIIVQALVSSIIGLILFKIIQNSSVRQAQD